jgi:hypothetical protein
VKVGTKSLLFGVHQFAWHPFTVFLAWRKLYGLPTWREIVCIIIHDWGYWGCSDMDGQSGSQHPFLGAKIAGKLLGALYWQLVISHSRSLCSKANILPSRLCWADKLCIAYDPAWFYLIRARLSGEIKEYRAKAAATGFVPACAPDSVWHGALARKMKLLAPAKARACR